MHKIGEGVHDIYKERAAMGGDVLCHVTIKGQKELAPGIPLHMSLKVFNDKKDMCLDEVKEKVKELNLQAPNPDDLKFKTTIFTSERDGKKYYMLLLEGTDKKYEQFYDSLKHCGTVYKKFMPHITIDKGLYERINEEGIESTEVEFSPICVEYGSGNTVHTFEKSEIELMEKSVFRNVGAAAALGAALMGATPASAKAPAKAPAQAATHEKAPSYSSQKMLRAIASVESSGGKNVNHKAGGGPIHGSEHAFGKYGLMPQTIRETIRMNHDLSSKYKKAAGLHGNDLHHYMQDNPGLEDAVAQKHLQRLEHHFGQNPSDLGYAWLEGIRGTYNAKKTKADINNHWHAKKVMDAYSKEK